ncbi:TPA: hypothetical protein DEP21_05110 [Patescibacteria group bacterium]|nr:hypothetical protein [Candidatus Gracilibacteria bacterium]
MINIAKIIASLTLFSSGGVVNLTFGLVFSMFFFGLPGHSCFVFGFFETKIFLGLQRFVSFLS